MSGILQHRHRRPRVRLAGGRHPAIRHGPDARAAGARRAARARGARRRSTRARCPPGVGHVAEPPHPPTNLGWTLVGLPRAARRAGVDVIHAPAYTAPFWSPAPVVLTIHDVSYERHPEWYPYRRDWARRAFYRRSAHVASQILTVSRFSAAEITAAYGIPAERMTVTPLGVDGAFVADDPGRRRRTAAGRDAAVSCCTSATCTNGATSRCSSRRCSRRGAICRARPAAVARARRDGSRRRRRRRAMAAQAGAAGRRRAARLA